MEAPRWYTGDVFDGLARIPDKSVDLVVTSPPFLALRSYLPAAHPDKHREIGSEATPAAFIDTLLAVTAELRRVLAPHGSIAIELGDTYAGNGGGGGDWSDSPATTKARVPGGSSGGPVRRDIGAGWPDAKCKALIPELYRVALAYGINPLTGQESPAGRWRVRNTVTWCRPNPPVGALGDKWRPATSDIVVACTSPKRWWDDLATRTELAVPHATGIPRAGTKLDHDGGNRGTLGDYDASMSAGTPLLDWWEVTAGGYKGAHYAVYPAAVVTPLVKAMCPAKVCRVCGEPSRRIIEPTPEYAARPNAGRDFMKWNDREDGLDRGAGMSRSTDNERPNAAFITAGWTDCGHDNWRPGLTLDPFAGSGTTLVVAHGHSRDSIGIDLDARNRDLAQERIGPMLTLRDIEPQVT